MRHGAMIVAGLLLATALAGPGLAADRWLHVRIQESGARGEQVSVNLPLALVEKVLPMVEDEELRAGKISWDSDELHGLDLRELLAALRDTPDADFVTVRSESDTLRVAKEKGLLVVRADGREGGGSERLHVQVPLKVVEALVGAGGEELDLVAGLKALADFDEDLVVVQSDDSNIRIWIDASEAGR